MAACEACGSSALVQWRRRPSEAELEAIPGEPDPQSTMAVYACGSHAITADLASLVHGAACSGPASNALPNCDCTPEPRPEPAPDPVASLLPPGW
jgi:hypothetical protein